MADPAGSTGPANAVIDALSALGVRHLDMPYTAQKVWGAIQTAKKALPSVWRAKLPLPMKLQATIHLTSNIVFPFILLTGLFNVPLILDRKSTRLNSSH